MNMSNAVVRSEWRDLSSGFAKLEQILRAEGGEHLLPSIRSINRMLAAEPADEIEARGALEDVRATLKTLLSNKELLADFFIWRDDFDERQRANADLKDLISRLSRLVVSMTPGVSR